MRFVLWLSILWLSCGTSCSSMYDYGAYFGILWCSIGIAGGYFVATAIKGLAPRIPI